MIYLPYDEIERGYAEIDLTKELYALINWRDVSVDEKFDLVILSLEAAKNAYEKLKDRENKCYLTLNLSNTL